MAAGPICDDPLVNGDDLIFDNAAGNDSLELACFTDPSLPCFTDTADAVDLLAGGASPGYFYVTTSGLGNSTAASTSPNFITIGSHPSRPAQINPPAACP